MELMYNNLETVFNPVSRVLIQFVTRTYVAYLGLYI